MKELLVATEKLLFANKICDVRFCRKFLSKQLFPTTQKLVQKNFVLGWFLLFNLEPSLPASDILPSFDNYFIQIPGLDVSKVNQFRHDPFSIFKNLRPSCKTHLKKL